MSFTLEAQPTSADQYRATVYQFPKEVCCFSWDSDRKFHFNDKRSLHELRPDCAPVPWIDDAGMGVANPLQESCEPIDLNGGFPQEFIHNTSNRPETLDHLVEAIRLAHQPAVTPRVDFITWRGIMTRILTAPYSRSDQWTLIARLRDKVIYIEEADAIDGTASGVYSNDFNEHDQQKRSMYYGYKFETLLTDGKTVDTREQFCSVFRTKLGSHSIIMGGEVDATYKGKMVELKLFYLNPNNAETFEKRVYTLERHKFLSTWAQSYLAGVPYVVFGFRDERGTLLSVQTFKTLKIPKLVSTKNYWNFNACLSFADNFLSKLKQLLLSDPRANFAEGICAKIQKNGSTIRVTLL